MKVCLITCTCGRHKCLERVVRFFLDQDYENCIHLIYQNSQAEQRLNMHLDPKKIILVNQHIDSSTKTPYSTLGAIYRDALKHVPEDVDVINFLDDDDIFLPDHVSEGIKGLLKGGKTAYKPAKSFYRTQSKIVLVSNTLEPSIFVKAAHIQKYGFSNTTSDQHLQWVKPLVENREIFADPTGVPTMAYNWAGESGVFKTSGDPDNPRNFSNYRDISKDHGDLIITPISKIEAEQYYNQLKYAQ